MSDSAPPVKYPEVVPVTSPFTPQTLALGSLVFAIILVIVLVLFNKKKSSSKGQAVLLVGPSDAGKTAILSKLVYGQTTPTATSLQANSSFFSLPSTASSTTPKSIRIIDIPGHPRIRSQFTDHIPKSKVVAFVVDASTISRNGAQAAEHLHSVLHALTSLPPSQTAPSLVILCNKIDLLKSTSISVATNTPASLAINRVKTILERELEKRRVAQVGGVGVEGLGEEEKGGEGEMGGLECGADGNAPFRFDEWEGGEVGFLGVSAKGAPTSEKDSEKGEGGDMDGLSSLIEWLEEQM